MSEEFGIALKEAPNNEGLTEEDYVYLHRLLSGVRAIPLEVQGAYSSAMGYINELDAEFIDYEYGEKSDLQSFIRDILDNMDNESKDGEYIFPYKNCEISIYITR